MKMYECLMRDGEYMFVEVVPAKTKKEVKERYQGNGEFVKINDVTNQYFRVG